MDAEQHQAHLFVIHDRLLMALNYVHEAAGSATLNTPKAAGIHASISKAAASLREATEVVAARMIAPRQVLPAHEVERRYGLKPGYLQQHVKQNKESSRD